MNVIESILSVTDTTTEARLQCGHVATFESCHVKPGTKVRCPFVECGAEKRRGLQPASDAQLDAIAVHYADTMRARGFAIGVPEEIAIRRAAAIQDAWRLAFGTVLG